MSGDQKQKQEQIVGNVLSAAYEQATGYPLIPIVNDGGDPPDLIFKWQRIIFGVEVTELYQFQDQRGLLDDIAAEASDLISGSGLSNKYVGIVVNFGHLLESYGRNRVNSAWNDLSIKQPRHKAAEELVRLLSEQVPSADDIPDNSIGRILHVSPNDMPALHALFNKITVHKCGLPENPAQVTWPRIISYPGYTFDPQEMESIVTDRVVNKTKAKINNSNSWARVNHSILVFHDLPRDLTLFSFTMPWEMWLKSSIAKTTAIPTYNEIWLVSFENLRGRGTRIAGIQPLESAGA